MATATTKFSPAGRTLVKLTMGPKEAQYVRDLVGGQIKGKGPRRALNKSVREALQSAGVNYQHNNDLVGYVFIKS